MGLLDILNGMQNGPRGQTHPGKGGMSPITMAMLALLAYKAYGKMTSGGQPQAAPAGKVPAPQADNGGLGGLLGGLLGGAPANSQPGAPGGAGGLGGALGGLLGGGKGALIGGAAGAGVGAIAGAANQNSRRGYYGY